MKKHGILLPLGALTCALFLSGCMAAMMPAMLLGHATHNKNDASHEQTPKSCDCEKLAAKTDPQVAPAAQAGEKPSLPSSSEHKH